MTENHQYFEQLINNHEGAVLGNMSGNFTPYYNIYSRHRQSHNSTTVVQTDQNVQIRQYSVNITYLHVFMYCP